MTGAAEVLRVGLTGGIACGKTTVGAMLAELGALVLDADALARAALEPGEPAHRAVVERFGPAICDARGRIDRAHLAERVFADPAERAALEALVHPAVRLAARRLVEEDAGRHAVVVLEAALLVETGVFRDHDRLVVVRCSPATQLSRLLERPGMTEAAARARIAAQAPLADKLAVADAVVDTDQPPAATRQQVERVWAGLLSDYREKFGHPPRSAPPPSRCP